MASDNPPNVGFSILSGDSGNQNGHGAPVDPRPTLSGGHFAGARCTRCGHGFSPALPWCSRCLGPVEPAGFTGSGIVWAATVVHVAMGHRTPSWAIAYVDLDDGPRVLAQLDEPVALPPGTRVDLIGEDHGDPVFRRAGGPT